MNPKLKRPLFKLINQKTKSVDIYHHGGSMWLIFTDKKKWVIELTKQGTLWYNYIFFQDCFKYLSLDVMENQRYITEWVEGILQNGVGHTSPTGEWESVRVENTIQNPGRNTYTLIRVEDTIQNGVKETKHQCLEGDLAMEEVLQNGVKETTPSGYLGSIEIKGKLVHQFESPKQNNEVEDTIQNGVKHTAVIRGTQTPNVEDTIKNGVRYTDHRRMQSNSIIEDTIKNGIKETNWRTVDNFPEFEERVIQNGIKETWGYEKQPQQRVDQVIEQGTKENPSL